MFAKISFIALKDYLTGTMKPSNSAGVPEDMCERQGQLAKSLKRGEFVMIHTGWLFIGITLILPL